MSHHDFIDHYINENQPRFTALSDAIWDVPETRFEETQSAAILADALEQEGFAVERGVGNIDTAFIASIGSGKPVIAILGEFDALAGLSQQSGCATPQPLVENGNGHGCGHNLLGTAGLAAAFAIKAWWTENGQRGTLRFYGCPGEEGGSGKTFMVREGLFDDVDAAVTWHPEGFSGMFNLSTLANIQAAFHFKGVAAHAANSPHLGRSALDAVTLMNTGANFLREHIVQEARVHYAVTNTGGVSPNVVQADAEVLYLIRAPELDQAQDIYQRVINIAKGAALMTDTTMTVRFDKACSNYVPNRALEAVMERNLHQFGLPEYSAEEQQFAAEIRATLTKDDLRNARLNAARTGGEAGVAWTSPINQISFWSWAGADVSWLDPYASERGRELKRQLVRASLAAMHAIRDVYPDARFVLTDPLVQIAADPDNPDSKTYADAQHQAQFEAWDWIAGRDAPELGGREDFLDILGLNYYPDNHWFFSGDTIPAEHATYQPLHRLMLQCWQRYQRPLLLAETGAEGDARAPWLRHVTEEARLALDEGVALEGISLYPVVEYPAWADDRRSPGALFGLGDPNGNRTLHEALALELRSQQIKWHNREKQD